jgi:DNA modification methylase
MEQTTIEISRNGSSRLSEEALRALLPNRLGSILTSGSKTAIPRLAKDASLTRTVEETVRNIATHHKLVCTDSRFISFIPNESVHLVVTSPPYWTLKEYPSHKGQLGFVEDYESFLDQLDMVWKHTLRVLVPGGRLVVVVGDVCLPRRRLGKHVVVPLHASIQERCRKLGFDNLAPIIWYKIANVRLEVENGSRFLGKPYEPNGVVKNDIEYVLFQRKPGGYRQPSDLARVLSVIPEPLQREWFQQIWSIRGASTRHHPAPYPVELAERLIRMFSFVGDTVLDPFMGTGTTNLAASRWGRNSIGIDVEPKYFKLARDRLRETARQLRLVLR